MQSKGRVCIIDDDEAVRDSLHILLFSGGYQTSSFESADAWLEATEAPDVDVYLLDLRMPGTDGMELHRLMLEQGSKVPVIFITGHGDIPMAVTAIQRGAADFLTKPFEEGELLEKIDVAISKFRAWESEMDEKRAVKQRLEGLTPREQDVLGLIVKGYSNKQAAAKLDISPRTVEIHRARVMEKTGADSIATLVRMATQLDGPE